eukprot:TRINITY_DN3587_c0_g2_i2.p1 TRINITY_DN3587_c0_g2~~TRINITY_DN3587_c0_g2_i2.p1  ORF type:complete len:213 (+),score=38.46 TRINITY_DN3587_c0_g2_i2:303-941(+)
MAVASGPGTDLGGMMPQHLAAMKGQALCLKPLLGAGVDPRKPASSGRTALHFCIKSWAMNRHHRSDVSGGSPDPDFSLTFKILIEAGAAACMAQSCKSSGIETPLHLVAFHWGGNKQSESSHSKCIDIAEHLLDADASSLNALARKGGSPLHWAVNGRNFKMVEYLLEKRADPLIQNDAGRSVLELPVLRQWVSESTFGLQACEILKSSIEA